MREVVFKQKDVNPARLHDELKAALGEDFAGVSTRRGDLVVHLADDSQTKETDLAQLVEAHDSNKLTAAQQFERNRQARLATLSGKAWPEWADEDKDELLRYLAGELGLFAGIGDRKRNS
jgi:hypothetical protein